MAIPNQSLKQEVHLSTGVLKTLSINFIFLNSAYIKVYVNSVELSSFNIVENIITFSPPITSPAKILVYYDVPLSDLNDFNTSNQWSSTLINNRLNNLELQIQKLNEKIGIVFPDNESKTNSQSILPNDRANKILKYNQDKDLVLVDSDILVNGIISEITALKNQCEEFVTYAADWASAANTSAIIAQQWAESDLAITPGHYSAKKWAETAEATAIPDGSITTNKIADNAITFNKSTYFNQEFYITQLDYSGGRYYLLFDGNNSKVNINFTALSNAGYNGLLIQLALNLNFSSITSLDLYIEYINPSTGSTVNTQILSYSDSTKTFNGYMKLNDPHFWNPPINYNLRIYSNTNIVLNPNTTEYKSILTITPAIHKSNFLGLLT